MNRSRPAILAIDDTPANLELLIGALMVDFELQIATSGAQGLDYASQSSPDLILLDVMMPEMDGYEVCLSLIHISEPRDRTRSRMPSSA